MANANATGGRLAVARASDLRGRLRLGELGVWVIGAAAASAALRAPRFRDEQGLPQTWPLLGLALVPIAAGLGVVLTLWFYRAWSDPTYRRPAALAWRLLALGLLGCYLAWQGSALGREPFETEAEAVWGWSAWGGPLRTRFVPLFGLLGLLGLALGLAPAPARRADRRRPSLPGATATVALAGLAGLSLLAVCWGTLAHLVLIAIEGVYNYNSGARDLRPTIDRRMLASLPALGMASASCVALGALLSRDGRASGVEPPRVGRLGPVGIVLSVLLTGGLGVWLLRVTLPSLSPETAEGLRDVLGPSTRLGLAVALTIFAAGLAARSTAIGPIRPPDPRPRRQRLVSLAAWSLLAAGLLGVIVLAGLSALRAAFPDVSGLERSLFDLNWLGSLGLTAMLMDGWPTNSAQMLALVLDPERWPPLIGLAWLIGLLVAAFWTLGPERPSAFDAVLADRAGAVRFLGRLVAILVLLFATLATLGVGLLVANHFLLLAMGR